MNKLLETAQKFPQTEIWNDSCSCAELSYAIENGAVGATTNPVIVVNVLSKELKDWEPTIMKIVEENPTITEDELAWLTIKAMGSKAASLLEPTFDEYKGKRGRISFQTNAKYFNNAEKMIEHALDLSVTVKNSQVKFPMSAAGVEAAEELTYRGVSLNATVSFTVSQALAFGEAVERGLARREAEGLDISQMNPVCTIMVGRVDDYLKGHVKSNGIILDADALEFAGVAVFKNSYKIYKERGYRTKMLSAAYRNHYHWSEFIGGDVVLTIPYGYQKMFNNSNVTVEDRINNPIDERIMQQLMTLEEFRKAYLPDGLKPEEFVTYGAFLVTLKQFLGGYDDLIKIVRPYTYK